MGRRQGLLQGNQGLKLLAGSRTQQAAHSSGACLVEGVVGEERRLWVRGTWLCGLTRLPPSRGQALPPVNGHGSVPGQARAGRPPVPAAPCACSCVGVLLVPKGPSSAPLSAAVQPCPRRRVGGPGVREGPPQLLLQGPLVCISPLPPLALPANCCLLGSLPPEGKPVASRA